MATGWRSRTENGPSVRAWLDHRARPSSIDPVWAGRRNGKSHTHGDEHLDPASCGMPVPRARRIRIRVATPLAIPSPHRSPPPRATESSLLMSSRSATLAQSDNPSLPARPSDPTGLRHYSPFPSTGSHSTDQVQDVRRRPQMSEDVRALTVRTPRARRRGPTSLRVRRHQRARRAR